MEHKKGNTIIGALLRYGLPLLISVGLCYILLSRVNIHDNIAIVRNYCNFWWIGLALALSVFSHVIRAARWNIQLRALDIKPPFMNVVYSIFGTYAVNLVLPRLGEVWRTGYISRSEGAPFTRVFGSMLSDRLADTIAVFLITVATFALASHTIMGYIDSEPGRLDGIMALARSPWLWTAFGVIVLGTWLMLTRYRTTRIVTKLKQMWQSLWQGFIVILHMNGRGRWLLLTVALWSCYFVQLYVAFYAFDFTSQIVDRYGIMAPLVCFILSTIAMALPSNGGIGPWQMAVIFGLSFYQQGITVPEGTTFESMSVAFANCVMTCQTLLLIALGIFTFGAIAWQRRRKSAN